MSKQQQATAKWLYEILGAPCRGNLPAAFQVAAAKSQNKRVTAPKAPKRKRGK